MFCYVFPFELQESAGAVGSCSISQSARGIYQIALFKTLRQSGTNALYITYQGQETPLEACEPADGEAEDGEDYDDLDEEGWKSVQEAHYFTMKDGNALSSGDRKLVIVTSLTDDALSRRGKVSVLRVASFKKERICMASPPRSIRPLMCPTYGRLTATCDAKLHGELFPIVGGAISTTSVP